LLLAGSPPVLTRAILHQEPTIKLTAFRTGDDAHSRFDPGFAKDRHGAARPPWVANVKFSLGEVSMLSPALYQEPRPAALVRLRGTWTLLAINPLESSKTSMNNLVLPNRVAIQLVDTDKRPLKMADVLFRVRLVSRHKSDFTLQPFASDGNGFVTISRNEL
jgi:hypothetical protein